MVSHPSYRVPDTSRIYAKAYWSCSGLWWPNAFLRHFMLVFLLFSQLPVFLLCLLRTIFTQSFSLLSVPVLQELQVDGDLLLNITDQDLSTDLGMTAGLTRMRLVQSSVRFMSSL
jgi:hypothetical protein